MAAVSTFLGASRQHTTAINWTRDVTKNQIMRQGKTAEVGR